MSPGSRRHDGDTLTAGQSPDGAQPTAPHATRQPPQDPDEPDLQRWPTGVRIATLAAAMGVAWVAAWMFARAGVKLTVH